MYTDDVTWRLNYSLPLNIAGPHVGKAAVMAFNDAVFNKIYDGSKIRVVIHDELGDEASSVVRFDLHWHAADEPQAEGRRREHQ